MIELKQHADKNLKIYLSEEEMKIELRQYFGWRKSTKNYDSIIERYHDLETHKHDEFIRYLVTGKY